MTALGAVASGSAGSPPQASSRDASFHEAMVDVGDLAPDFALADQDGATFRLGEHRGHPVILYFFPKAMTAGCTRETEGFASHQADLDRVHAEVVGVSVDGVDRQHAFAERCRVSFRLLSDPGGTVARAYGVRGFLGMAKRVTFFLDAEGHVVEVVEGMLPGPHVRAAVDRFVRPPDYGSSKSK